MAETGEDVSSDDPGWGGVRQVALSLYLPAALRWGSKDVLVMLRSVTVAFVGALCAFGVVLLWVLPVGELDDGVEGAVAVTIAFSLVVQVLVRRWRLKLDCTSDEALAQTYRQRFFLRVAFIDAASLTGFTLSFIVGAALPYLAGLPFALAGFRRVAPTRQRLAFDQEELLACGCPRELLGALRATRADTQRT